MGLPGPAEGDLWSSFDPAENVLVVAPADEAAADEACGVLMAGANPAEETLLLVSIGRAPDERLAVLGREGADPPREITVVTTGEDTRSADLTGDDTGPVFESDVDVRTTVVSGPGGVTGISHKIAEVISGWDDDVQGRLCFYSITGLLEHADLSDAFRFLHLLTRHVASVNGIAHFHIDPAAHDAQTLGTLDGLFDAVLVYEDGEWTLSRG